MKYKYLIIVIALSAINKSGFAQYAKDAVRFSTFQPGSTSRMKGIGNAGTAIGGDLSSVSNNPAGLGFFTRSEVSITPEFDGAKANTTYLGQAGTATKASGNLSNAAIVFYTRLNTPSGTDKSKGWLSLNYGMGYSHTNDFGQNIYYKGTNSKSSINDYYASLANANGTDDGTLQAWAYDQTLIDLYNTSNPTYERNNHPGASVDQANSIFRSGGQSSFDLSLGANYSNRLYLGVSLGFTDLRYNSTNNFNETGIVSVNQGNTDVDNSYNSTYAQLQETKGEGFNAKFGIIYKLLENVRVGALLTTPTYISVDDSFSESLTTTLGSGTATTNGPANYPLSYTMRTPFKAAGGVSVFLNQYGFITGDVEYIDYSTTHINDNEDYDNSYDNNVIKSTYKAAVNLRAGAEIKLTSAMALRGGYGIQGSPLKAGGSSIKTATAGLGYRFGAYYIDATYMHVKGDQTVIPYDIGTLTPTASVNGSNNNIFVTLGFRY